MGREYRLALIITLAALVLASGFIFIRNQVDFPVYYSAGRSLISGRTDLYSPDFALGEVMDYRYPPLFIVALIPLWRLPLAAAALIWHALSASGIVITVALVAQLLRARGARKFLVVVPTLVVGQYVVMALHYGNAQLLVTSLVLISFFLAGRSKYVPAGLLMALAISIKLTPILLLPYFALKRRWAYLIAVASFLFVLLMAPSLYFGLRENAVLLKQWFSHVVINESFHEANGPINLAVKGQAVRYLTAVDYSQRVGGDTQYPAVNFLSLSPQPISTIGAIAGVLIWVLGTWWLWLRERKIRSGALGDYQQAGMLDPLEFGLMVCIMLLAGPLTSKIYFVALLWPVIFLADHVEAGGGASRTRYLLIAIAVINSVLPLLPGRTVQRWLLVIGVDFYVNCLLTAGVLFALVSKRLRPRSQSFEPQTGSH